MRPKNRKKKIVKRAGLVAFMLLIFFSQGVMAQDSKPKVTFDSPKHDEIWLGKQQIRISVTGLDAAAIRSLRVFLDGTLLKEFKEPPFVLSHDFGQAPKNRKLKAVARDVSQNIYTREIRSYHFDDAQEVEIVQIVVPVAVTDQWGSYISGLTRDDFVLLEEGMPRQIEYFSVSSKSKFNLVLLIDISSSMKDKIGKVKEAARMFLEELLSKDDRAIIVFFNHDVFEDTDFTNDIDELFNSISVAFPFGATALYDAVAHCVKLLKGVSGRNIVILFSDGEDNSSYIDPYTLIKRVEKSNSVIYSIGKHMDVYEDDQYQDLLRKISTSSGGMTFFFDDVERIREVYAKIRQDIRAKYILQFSPKDTRRRNRFRKITVQLKKNGKKYRVRTIKGYFY